MIHEVKKVEKSYIISFDHHYSLHNFLALFQKADLCLEK